MMSSTTRSKRCSAKRSQRLAAVVRGDDLVAVLAQRVGEQRLNRLLVVDEQDPRRRSSAAQGTASVPQGAACTPRTRDRPPPLPRRFLPALVAVVIVHVLARGAPAPLAARVAPTELRREPGGARWRSRSPPSAPNRAPGQRAATRRRRARRRALLGDRGRRGRRAAVRRQFDGDDVELRNVILTCPGELRATGRRDRPPRLGAGPGAASSAAATGALIELAEAFGGATPREDARLRLHRRRQRRRAGRARVRAQLSRSAT